MVLKLENVKLIDDPKRGLIVKFVDPGSNKIIRRKVPAGRNPVEHAKLQQELLERGYSPVKQTGMKLCENVEKYYAELDRQVQNYVDGKNTADTKIRHKRRASVLAHIKLHILPNLGEMRIDEIKAVDANRLQHKLKEKLKGQSIKPVIQTLRRMLRFFYLAGLTPDTPFSSEDIEYIKSQTIKEAPIPRKEDVEAVLNAIDVTWKEAMVRLAAETGMRISEVLALSWGDLDRNIIYVQTSAVDKRVNLTKTESSTRKIQLSSKLVAQLAEIKLSKGQATDLDFIFTNENGRLFASSEALLAVLKPAIRRAGVKPFAWRGLRRFYVNELMDQNIMLNHVQKLVGHELGSKATEKHYRRVKQQDVLKDEYVISLG